MTKQEFIQEAALRLIIAKPDKLMCEIAELAENLANCVYSKEKENEDTTAGKDFENESLVALFREVERLDILSNKNSKVLKRGYAKKFARVCSVYEIETIKELLKIGSYNLRDARNMGAANLAIVSEALYSLYGIDKW